MWGWVFSGVVALLGTVFVLHYRGLTADSRMAELLEENKLLLTKANSVLAELTQKANLASTQDQAEAKKVTDAKGASDFLNASGSVPRVPSTGPGRGPSALLPPTRRPPAAKPIHGFARGPGYDSPRPGLNPGSVDAGGDSMARSRFGVYEEWC